MDDYAQKLKAAMWAGDIDALQEIAPCGCCCHEHTHIYCAAREWGGCRSGLRPGESEKGIAEEWADFYVKERGMTREEFYGKKGNEP